MVIKQSMRLNCEKGFYVLTTSEVKKDLYQLRMRLNTDQAIIRFNTTSLEEAKSIAREHMIDYMNELQARPIAVSHEEFYHILDKITTSGLYGIQLHSEQHMKRIKKMLNTNKIPFVIDEKEYMIYNTNIYKRIETSYSYKYIKILLDK